KVLGARVPFTLVYQERPDDGAITWSLLDKITPELRRAGAAESTLVRSAYGRCIIRPTSRGDETRVDYLTSFAAAYPVPAFMLDWYMKREGGRLLDAFRAGIRRVQAAEGIESLESAMRETSPLFEFPRNGRGSANRQGYADRWIAKATEKILKSA
ncbi:MAG: hypothetical protein ACRD1Z_00495, partial [Vicinamibacteria bacterium]